MPDLEDLESLIDAGTPVIFVETADSARLEDLCRRVATRCGKPLYRWALATGLARDGGGAALLASGSQPAQILGHVLGLGNPALFLMLDLVPYLGEPLIVSQLREIAARHERVPHTLIVPGNSFEIPADLRTFVVRFDLALPTMAELDALIRAEAEAWGRVNTRRVQATQAAIGALSRHLAGLTHADAKRLVRNAIQDGLIDDSDLPSLAQAKYRMLDQSGVLSFELDTTKLTDVAGLGNLKRWLSERKDIFLADPPPPGLDPPKGLLLLGVQGAGKSLAAKSVAGAWGLPLLRLDFATLYNKYYGETERNLRDSLRAAEAMAPCVLWIDEIEKGLATEADEGPGKRILGTLLTWMAERTSRVFLVATANDIAALPPELLRKGRFDEIFFVDLPAPASRQEIFAIHLRKRGQDPPGFDLEALAQAAEGFSGAEIEQGIVSALYSAKARNEVLSTEHIRAALAATRPLSVMMAEKMIALRVWAAERTVPADS